MISNRFAFVILAATLGSAAVASEPAGTVYRLTPDEIAAVDPKAPAQDPALTYDPLFDKSLFDVGDKVRTDRRPHGEVGAFVGSGGARGVFGTTTVPVGENGSASFSFENSRYPRERYRRR